MTVPLLTDTIDLHLRREADGCISIVLRWTSGFRVEHMSTHVIGPDMQQVIAETVAMVVDQLESGARISDGTVVW